MTYENLSPYLQDILVTQWEHNVKILILGLLFLFSLFYVLYLYDTYKPTKIFFLGFVRGWIYLCAYSFAWLFLLIMPVILHPAVSPDTLLIFLASVYSIIFMVVLVLFIFNATVWIPQIIMRWGKFEPSLIKEAALNNYMKEWKKSFKKWK